MKLLIDTNVFVEILLKQEREAEARALLDRIEEHEFFITDFAFFSIGLLLFRQKRQADFQRFINDMILGVGVKILSLSVADMDALTLAAQQFSLDFDDAYQYAAAQKHTLTLVSFDADFERTPQGHKLPAQFLGEPTA